MIIFFDVGVVSIAFFILMIAGMGAVSELGIWLHENFAFVVGLLIVLSVVKTIFLMSKMQKKLFSSIICAIVDGFRMIPALLFLEILFQSFVELGSEGLFGFVLGFIGLIFGACFVMVPVLALMAGTEVLCTSFASEDEDEWILGYVFVGVIGTVLQLLVFKLFKLI